MEGCIHQSEQNRKKTLPIIAQSCLKGWIWRPRSRLILLRVWCPAGSQHRPTSGGTWHHQQLLVYCMHNCHFKNNRGKSVYYKKGVFFTSCNFQKLPKNYIDIYPEALPAIFFLRYLSHVWVESDLSESNLSKKGDQNSAYLWHIPLCDTSA